MKDMKIGERIKQRREQLEMSQEELATRLGYRSRSSINKIERDASGLPQKKIAAIAEALQTTPAYIMGWDAMQKKSSTIADAALRMKNDPEFMSVVEMLLPLHADKISDAKQMLSIFLK